MKSATEAAAGVRGGSERALKWCARGVLALLKSNSASAEV